MASPDRKAAVAPTQPTITVTLTPMAADTQGAYYFEASVAIASMPGGWKTAHHGLCLALEKVLSEVAKAAQAPAPRIQLAQRMPQNAE